MGLLDLRTQLMGDVRDVGLGDVFWPNNPYAYYKFYQNSMREGGDPMMCFLYTFALIMSLVCTVDCFVWCFTAIKTPYGIVTGVELIKRKLSPKHEGFQALVRCWSSLWVALKIMRVREVLNFYLKFHHQVYAFMFFSLVGLVVVCHYIARAQHFFFFLEWNPHHSKKEQGMCYRLLREWGPDKATLVEELDWICVNLVASIVGFNSSKCDSIKNLVREELDAVIVYEKAAGNASFDEFSHYRQDWMFLTSMHHICTKDWETEMAYDPYNKITGDLNYYQFHLRFMLALFSVASTEGSDVIAYLPSFGHCEWDYIIVTMIGMFILAFVNAKGV